MTVLVIGLVFCTVYASGCCDLVGKRAQAAQHVALSLWKPWSRRQIGLLHEVHESLDAVSLSSIGAPFLSRTGVFRATRSALGCTCSC